MDYHNMFKEELRDNSEAKLSLANEILRKLEDKGECRYAYHLLLSLIDGLDSLSESNT